MLWPFCPRPEFSESLAWVTDVIRPYDGEQRFRLTDAPRQGFTYSYSMTFRQYERAKLMVEASGYTLWDLPAWHDRQRVTVSAGAGSVIVDTTLSDYREGGYALLWASDEDCEVVEIDTVNVDSLDLVGTTVGDYTAGLICPVRSARLVGGLDATRTVQPIVDVSTEWIVYEGADLSDDVYPTYRSHPIVTDCPRLGAGSLSDRIEWDLDETDNGLTSSPFLDRVRARVDRSTTLSWIATTRAQAWSVRRFLHACKGRQAAFWSPDWTRGLQLVADIAPSDTSITILAVGLNTTAETGDIMLVTSGGTQHYLRYTAVTPSGANEVLTLSAPAGFAASPSSVRTLCRLHLMRLDQDRVEFAHQHTGRDRQVTTVQVQAIGVPIP